MRMGLLPSSGKQSLNTVVSPWKSRPSTLDKSCSSGSLFESFDSWLRATLATLALPFSVGLIQGTKNPQGRKYEKIRKELQNYKIHPPVLGPRKHENIPKRYKNGHFRAILCFFSVFSLSFLCFLSFLSFLSFLFFSFSSSSFFPSFLSSFVLLFLVFCCCCSYIYFVSLLLLLLLYSFFCCCDPDFVFVYFSVFVVVVFIGSYVVELGKAQNKKQKKEKTPQKSGKDFRVFLLDKLWLDVQRLVFFFGLFGCFCLVVPKTL